MTKIFESPDRGQTVYSREFGQSGRTLHSQSSQAHRAELWRSIHQAAKTDPELQQLLEQVEIYHTLKNIP